MRQLARERARVLERGAQVVAAGEDQRRDVGQRSAGERRSGGALGQRRHRPGAALQPAIAPKGSNVELGNAATWPGRPPGGRGPAWSGPRAAGSPRRSWPRTGRRSARPAWRASTAAARSSARASGARSPRSAARTAAGMSARSDRVEVPGHGDLRQRRDVQEHLPRADRVRRYARARDGRERRTAPTGGAGRAAGQGRSVRTPRPRTGPPAPAAGRRACFASAGRRRRGARRSRGSGRPPCAG